MSTLLDRARRGGGSSTRYTIDDYIETINQFVYQGSAYGYGGPGSQPVTTYGKTPTEPIGTDLRGLAAATAGNGPVFSLLCVRALVFSAVRLQFQRLNSGKPSKMFGNTDLRIFEQPWPGCTTQDLLMRLLVHADLAGNAYVVNLGDQLTVLRPDWTDIMLAPRLFRGAIAGYEKVGYVYWEGGDRDLKNPLELMPNEVAHFAPGPPDPLASYRGMSWLTPVIREIQADQLMQRHKRKFFENGATPNMVVSVDKSVTPEKFKKFREIMDAKHAGAENAYKTLYLGGGADATVVGANFEQMTFKAVQGAGETRLAAAAGVPPVIAGFSEGLEAATYSNYAQARRRFADGTMHPLWQNVAGSLQTILPVAPPAGTRLWYDARDVPFLREDRKDASAIQESQARSIRALTDGGYEPASVVEAVLAEDYGLLVHTGKLSVQLQPPSDEPAGGGNGGTMPMQENEPGDG